MYSAVVKKYYSTNKSFFYIYSCAAIACKSMKNALLLSPVLNLHKNDSLQLFKNSYHKP